MRGLGEKKAGTSSALLLTAYFMALLALPMASPLLASDRSPSPPQRPPGDAPWSPNERVNDDAGTGPQTFPSIAVDPRGNAYAVWVDLRPEWGVYFAYRPVCGTWTANVRVDEDTETATGKQWPSIAVDTEGNAYVVWLDNRNGDWDVYFSYRPADGAWSANVKVSDEAALHDAYTPDIAVDSNGNAYAVWEVSYDGNPGIYFSYRPAGGAWGSSIKVNQEPGGATSSPSIAVDPDGNAYALWSEGRATLPDVYFSYRPAGGTWGASVRVNDDTGGARQIWPDIAIDAEGNAYAVWDDWRSGLTQLYFAYRPAGGAWGPNVRVNDDGTAYTILYPSVSVSPGGDAYAVWMDLRNGNGNHDIYFSYRPPGGSWGANGRVNDDTGRAYQGQASIAVDPSGGAYATWLDNRNGNADIYFSHLGMTIPALGDLVWQDTNWNGIQDSSEPGVQGIAVDLFATMDCGGTPVDSATTDANGNYRFCAAPGSYCAEFSGIPQGWVFAPQNQGVDDALDSDANQATGRIRNIVMVEGTGDFDQDVGLQVGQEFVPELGSLVLLTEGLMGMASYAIVRRRG
ncbi:MAG TPA: SdrD B-like domain-containing protein [Anaerolineae bacterium]|nr:SdrD B-like domain-containing protein [Anaerolineae bacterium]